MDLIKRLHLEDASTLENIQAPPMLIDELIPEESITLVAGPTFSGKTFIALEAAKAVAFGQPFMNKWAIPNPGNVLFLEADSPKYDTGRALYAMLKPTIHQLQADPDGPGHRLKALQIDWTSRLNILSQEDTSLISRSANALRTSLGFYGANETLHVGAKLIILDTFRRHHTSDEDKSTEMQVIMNRLDWLRANTKAAIMVLHHVTKGTKNKPRGSTVIEGSVDNIYLISKDGRSKHHKMSPEKTRSIAPSGFWWNIVTEPDPLVENGVIKRVEWIKNIDAPIEAPTGSDSLPIHDLAPTANDLLAHMQLWPEGQTTHELVAWGHANFGVGKSLVAKWRKQLTEEGHIAKKGTKYVLK